MHKSGEFGIRYVITLYRLMLVFVTETFQKKEIIKQSKPMKIQTFFAACVLSWKKFLLVALVCLTIPFLNATNAPPMINIVTPASGAVFFAPETLNVAVTAADDGMVT